MVYLKVTKFRGDSISFNQTAQCRLKKVMEQNRETNLLLGFILDFITILSFSIEFFDKKLESLRKTNKSL